MREEDNLSKHKMRVLLDKQGAAETLNTSRRFIDRLVEERRLRFYRVGRFIRFDPDDLEAFIASGLVEAE